MRKPARSISNRLLRSGLFPSAALLLAGCGLFEHHPGVGPPPYPEDVAAAMHPSGAIVLDSTVLDYEHGSVLAALSNNVANFLVQQTSECPIIALRQSRGLPASSNPLVYVDGTRAANTCILESMLAAQVAYIEVYPGGVTSRQGYVSWPSGLILLFLRSH